MKKPVMQSIDALINSRDDDCNMESILTIDEIFSILASHMLQGIMLHEQFMNVYLFLGFYGYSKCHEYHYLSETDDYILLNQYKILHFDKLISLNPLINLNIIPESWLYSTSQGVDKSTYMQALEAVLNTWINWEEETKNLYSNMYEHMLDIHEIAAAEFIYDYIRGVDKELLYAKHELLYKNTIGFDLISMVEEQDRYKDKFSEKIRRLR